MGCVRCVQNSPHNCSFYAVELREWASATIKTHKQRGVRQMQSRLAARREATHIIELTEEDGTAEEESTGPSAASV